MTPSRAEFLIDPTTLYTRILKEYSLLWNMGRNPYEFDEDDFDTEYFYRREIYIIRKNGTPFFKHVVTPKEVTEQMQVMMQRHNIMATFANIVTDMFMMRSISYEENCALARACVHDIVLNINGEEYSKGVRQELYNQDYGATEFYGIFSKAVDAALAGDYRFAMENFEGGSPVQIKALANVGEEANANFWQFREDFIIRKNTGIMDQTNFHLLDMGKNMGIVEENIENCNMLEQHRVTKEMSTYEGQLTLDASLAAAA